LLGNPLNRKKTGNDSEEIWYYSKSPRDTHYKNRCVIFQNGAVAKVFCEFYVD